MGTGRYRRRKNHNKDKLYGAQTRKYLRGTKETKYLDQIYEDVANPEKANTKLDDPDTAGFGRHYCIPCARYFVSEKALAVHSETKQHKRRLKMFEKEPTAYTGPNVVIDNGLRKPADKVVDLAALAASDPLSLPSSSAGSSLDSALLDDIAKM